MWNDLVFSGSKVGSFLFLSRESYYSWKFKNGNVNLFKTIKMAKDLNGEENAWDK